MNEEVGAEDAVSSASDPAGAVDAGDPRAALRALIDGDLEAGYRLLGRQASIAQWKRALEIFERRAAEADLERIAVSVLGRQREVVRGFLAVLERAASAQAAFIAYAVSNLRIEDDLRAQAMSIRSKLADEPASDTGDSNLSPLYILLARPIPEAKEQWDRWRASTPDTARRVAEALRTEDARLQALSKQRSYRAGSYLHFLRHALADFALVTGVDDGISRRAFGLLQRRIDEVDAQEGLLGLLDAEVRRRYLTWAVDPKNAGVSARTRFALRMLRERFPGDADEDAVRALLSSPEPDVAAEAAVTALALGNTAAALDREAARLITELDEPQAKRVAEAISRYRPARLRVDLVPPERWSLAFGPHTDAQQLAEAFGSALARVDAPRAADVVRTLATADFFDALTNAVFVETFADIVARAEAEDVWWLVVEEAVAHDRSRVGGWAHVAEISGSTRARVVRLLIHAEPPESRVEAIMGALDSLRDGERSSLALVILDELVDGAVEAAELGSVWPDDLVATARSHLMERIAATERELAEVEFRLKAGEETYLAALRESIGPLTDRARQRAAGNERLSASYGRLIEQLSATNGGSVEDHAWANEGDPALLESELAKVSARLVRERTGHKIAFEEGNFSEDVVIRFLCALDQRVQTASTAPELRAASRTLLRLLIIELAERGVATRLITDLFERGQLFPLAVQLSAPTRAMLLDAAKTEGFEVAETWFDHPVLGEWLRVFRAHESEPDGGGDASTTVELFARAQAARSALTAARAELARQEHAVKLNLGRAASGALDEIAVLVDSYMQLWHGLTALGIEQAAPLGATVALAELDPERHQIIGERDGERFVVRAPGLQVDGEVVMRAKLERLD